jgi:hypothetical protein
MTSLTSNFINTGNPDPNPDTIPLDYNYRILGRKDTMFLDTLNNNDFPIRPFKKLDTKRDWSINLYNLDIEGSSPRRIGAFNQKIDFINKNDDIEKSCPKILHYPLNKPEYNLRNDDIELSWPKCVELNTTRSTNPLEPKYNLPKTEPYPFEVPKFIRNSIPVDDIDGAKPRKIISKWQPRETMKKDDIELSWPKKPYIRNTKYNNIDYRDVTHTEFQTGRMTNPLEPVYKLSYLNGDKMTVGPIEKNKPVVFSKYHYDPAYNLKTDDIWGTQTGTKNFINKFNGTNYCYTTLDIKGAQKSTKKKGIVTERCTNPLRPKYKYLGYEELKAGGNPLSDPYGRYLNKSGANTTIGGKRLPELFEKKDSNKSNLNNEPLKTEGNIIENKLTIEQPISNYTPIYTLQNENNNEKISNVKSPKNSQIQSPKQISPRESQTNLDNQNNIEKKSSHSLSPQNHNINNKVNNIINNNDKLTNNKFHISSPTEPNFNPENIFKNLPKYDDNVNFDKEKFKKPYPFYGFLHDKYIIPPIEEHKKKKIEGNPNLKSFQETVIAKSNLMKAGLPKRQFDKSIHKSYAEKLDDFMTKSNLKYIETEVPHLEQPKIINNEGNDEVGNQEPNKIPEKN